MTKNEMKKIAGKAALKYVKSGSIIGIGSGSTVSYFISALNTIKSHVKGIVSSSIISTNQLKKINITPIDLKEIDYVDIYIDGADEINSNMQMIKGGGAALTKEKIISSISDKFICIADISKQVNILGSFPLPIEIIPSARKAITRQLIKLGGFPKYRDGIITEHGNIILDVYGMKIVDPDTLENTINMIPGVLTVGLFAHRKADILLVGTEKGVKTITK